MSTTWQIVMDEVDGLKCALVLGWEMSRLGVFSVVMSGDYFHHVQLENVDEITADAVKKALEQIFQPEKKARMPEPLRGLQPIIAAKIDEWFAANPQ